MGSLACRAGENKNLLQSSTYGLAALKALLDAIEGSGFATGTDSLKVLSDVLDLIRTELTFQHQPDATLSQASPVQNTWYTILDTTAKVRLYSVNFSVATTGETLDVQLTIDGNVYSAQQVAVAGTPYYASKHPNIDGLGVTTDPSLAMWNRCPLEGRSVKVEVRKITANGTGTLSGRVTYAKR